MQLTINGQAQDLGDLDPEMPLLGALRDILGLVGTKYGCGVAQCGACTVWLDDNPVRSCQLTVGALAGRRITTCLLYTSPSPRDGLLSRMPSSA